MPDYLPHVPQVSGAPSGPPCLPKAWSGVWRRALPSVLIVAVLPFSRDTVVPVFELKLEIPSLKTF